MSDNKHIIISAPSGAGKTTIVKRLLNKNPEFSFSVSACSRLKRTNEQNEKDYYFIPAEVFRKKIENNEFVEWQEVYPDLFYGTLKSEVERITKNGKNLIFDVDVVGGVNLKKYFGNDAISLFIMPPNIDELKNRLQKRSSDDEKSIETRIEKATFEIGFASEFDAIIINDNLEKAVNEANTLIQNFINS